MPLATQTRLGCPFQRGCFPKIRNQMWMIMTTLQTHQFQRQIPQQPQRQLDLTICVDLTKSPFTPPKIVPILKARKTNPQTDFYWTAQPMGAGTDEWQEFSFEVVSDDGEIHVLMKTRLARWTEDMETETMETETEVAG